MLSAKCLVSFACLLVCVLAARLDFHAALQGSSKQLEAEECEQEWKDSMGTLLVFNLQRLLTAVYEVWKSKGQQSDFCKDVTTFSDNVARLMADDVWSKVAETRTGRDRTSLKVLDSDHELLTRRTTWIDDLPIDRTPWNEKFQQCVPPLSSLQNLQEACNRVVANMQILQSD